MNANLAQMLLRSACSFADRPAVIHGEKTCATFAELGERVARLAGGLRERYGLHSGDRVALVLKNCPEYVELLFAIWQAGLCAVPINAKLHRREIDYILDDSGAALCFDDAPESAGPPSIAPGEPAYRELLAAPPLPIAEVADNDLAWLFYTSGTTGRPKGVMLSHRNLTAMSWAYTAKIARIAPGERLIHAAPMSHGSGLYILPYLAEGACQVVPLSGGFDPGELLQLMPPGGKSSLFAAPTMLNRLVNFVRDQPIDLGGLQTIVCGGAPLYREDEIKALEVLGAKVAQIYGQGESPMTIAGQSAAQLASAWQEGDLTALATVGEAFPGIEIRIADSDDTPLAVGKIGEILVRGATVMSGYWNNPAASAETLRNGWLHTGDLGCLDRAGRLQLHDRSKDVIISGGSNIYPREVEDVLLAHPAVQEACVLGRPHGDWGEEVSALIVAQPGRQISAAELDRWCIERIARFKRPKTYLFAERLPKNSTGKVIKAQLREICRDLPLAPLTTEACGRLSPAALPVEA